MKNQIIIYSSFIFLYHLLLLVFPLNFFLISLKIPFIIPAFPWLFYPFLIFSPVLTLLLAIKSTPLSNPRLSWLFPVALSLIGYIPLSGPYLLISSFIDLRNSILVVLFPVLIGLTAFWGAHFWE